MFQAHSLSSTWCWCVVRMFVVASQQTWFALEFWLLRLDTWQWWSLQCTKWKASSSHWYVYFKIKMCVKSTFLAYHDHLLRRNHCLLNADQVWLDFNDGYVFDFYMHLVNPKCLGFVAIASMVLLVFGLVAIIFTMVYQTRVLYLIYAGLAALLFMVPIKGFYSNVIFKLFQVYLAIDIQMIMGGRKYEISPEDHIFAAIQVFLDIIYIFWMLLTLIGSSK